MTDARGQRSPTPTRLPLFPLHSVVLPTVHQPLHIFEPRYRQLTVDLMTGAVPDRLFGVVAIRNSTVREIDDTAHVYAIGCTARLREAEHLPDGRFDVITTGHRRFRLREIDSGTAPYLVGTIDWVDDDAVSEGASTAATRLAGLARTAHRRYCTRAWEGDSWRAPPDEVPIADLAYHLADDCLLPRADRQALLEQRHPLRRLHTVCRLLNRESGILSHLRAVPLTHGEVDEALSQADLN